MKLWFVLLLAFVAACGASSQDAVEPGPFDATGLKLVIGVDRTKTIEVKPDGNVVNLETGHATMKFVGQELRLPDDSKKLLVLDGDMLNSGGSTQVGTFEGTKLLLGDISISVKDDGVVNLTRNGSEKKMRMHFESGVKGHKRAAVMLVMVVFALYAATNPSATIDRFVDD